MKQVKWFESRAGRALAAKLKIPADDNIKIHNISCGLHSGIPECCIIFHALIWQPAVWESDFLFNTDDKGHVNFDVATRNGYFDFIENYIALTFAADFRHQPCPACLVAGNVVKVRRCNCGRNYRKRMADAAAAQTTNQEPRDHQPSNG